MLDKIDFVCVVVVVSVVCSVVCFVLFVYVICFVLLGGQINTHTHMELNNTIFGSKRK